MMRRVHWVAVMCACVTMPLQADLIKNGSFEDAVSDPIGYILSLFSNNATSTNIDHWRVLDTGVPLDTSEVGYVGNDWVASEGSDSVHLNGGTLGGPGAIGQQFQTISGQDYLVSFDMAGNPFGEPALKTLNVSAVGAGTQTQGFSFDSTGMDPTNMGWKSMEWLFTADITGLTDLQFTSTTSGPYGPAIDNISIMAVPVPGAILLGVIGLGIAASKLRKKDLSRHV